MDLYYNEKCKDYVTADDMKELSVSLEYAVVTTQGYIMDHDKHKT